MTTMSPIGGERIAFPLSPQYCADWTVVDALRELIANALDTHTETEIRWIDGVAVIADQGTGLKREHLVFGNSSKGETEIGTFGEGAKVAAVVLARNGRDVVIETVGHTWIPRLEYSNVWETTMLYVDVIPNERTVGTRITVSCSEDEFESVCAQFLALRGLPPVPDASGVYLSPDGRPRLYVLGVFVQEIDALFSYDLHEKALLNRNRNRLPLDVVARTIVAELARTTSEVWIEGYLRAAVSGNHRLLEFQQPLPPIEHPDVWKRVADRLFGERRVYGGQPEVLLGLRDLGYTILPYFPVNADAALRATETPYAWSRIASDQREYVVVKVDDLSEEEREVLREAVAIARSIAGDLPSLDRLTIFSSCSTDRSDQTELGTYDPKEDRIYLRRSCLGSLRDALETLLHEAAHARSGYVDRTAGFAQQLTTFIGRALLRVAGADGSPYRRVTRRSVWRDLVRQTLRECGGEASLATLYTRVREIAPDRARWNVNYRSRIRQALQDDPLCVPAEERGVWRLLERR